jgi:hypothetical protein
MKTFLLLVLCVCLNVSIASLTQASGPKGSSGGGGHGGSGHNVGQGHPSHGGSENHHHPHHNGDYSGGYYYTSYCDDDDCTYYYYATPQTTYYTDSSASYNPVVTPNPLPPADITLVNPQSNGVTLTYILGNESYSLAPGYQQKVHQVCEIGFSRGGTNGTARYTISNGTYTFTAVNGTWDLLATSAGNANAQSALASNPVPIQ